MADAKITVTAADAASTVLAQVRNSMAATQASATALGNVLTATGAIFAVGWGADFVQRTVRGVDALNDLKDATGASIENISALEDVAKRTGASFEVVQSSLIKFNKSLADSKPGSDAEAALKSIGLEAKALKQLDPAEALLKTAVALRGFADDGNKARLVQELFGKSLKEVAPFLNDLANVGRLNATVTAQQAEEAERFAHAMANMKKNSEDFSRAILADVVPSLSKLFEYLNELRRVGATSTALFNPSLGIGDPGEKINELLERRIELQNKLEQSASIREGGKRSAIISDIEAEKAALEEQLKVLRVRQRLLVEANKDDSSDAVQRRFERSRPSVKFDGAAKKQGAEAASAYDSLNKRVQEHIDLLTKELLLGRTLTESEKFSEKIVSDAAASKVALSKKETEALQAKLASYQKLNEAAQLQRAVADLATKGLERQHDAEVAAAKQADEIAAAATKADFDAFARFKQKIADLEFESRMLGSTSAERELAIQLRDLESSAIDKSTSSYAKLREELRGSVQRNEAQKVSTERLNKVLDDNAARFKELSSAISVDLLRGGDAFGKWVDKQIEEAFRLKVIEPILKQVFGGISTSTPGGETGIPNPVDLLGKLFSFDGGGHTGTGARTGGLDGKGGFLAMLHPQERVTDLTRHNNAGGGGATTIIQNFTVGDVPSKQFVQDAVRSGIGRAEFARRDFAGRQF